MRKILGLLLVLLAGALMACNGSAAPTPTPTPTRAATSAPTPALEPEPTPTRAATSAPTPTLEPEPTPTRAATLAPTPALEPEPTPTRAATSPPTPALEPEPTRPKMDVTLTQERLDAVRIGLANLRRDYELDLCEFVGPSHVGTVHEGFRGGHKSSVNATTLLVNGAPFGWEKGLEFLLDIGFRPSWQEWLLAQYNAPAAYYETWERYETVPIRWRGWGDYSTQTMAAQTAEVSWEILGAACGWPPAYSQKLNLTPATLASAREAQGGMTDEEALSRLGDLRQRYNVDICSSLEFYRSGLLVMETLVAGFSHAETVHAVLDFLLDLGYWPTWREWVQAQRVAELYYPRLEELGVTPEEYVADSVLAHATHLPSKLTAVQTNQVIWETVWGLCDLAATPTQE